MLASDMNLSVNLIPEPVPIHYDSIRQSTPSR